MNFPSARSLTPRPGGGPWKQFLIILYIPLCFELGVLLLYLPWSALWTRNYFVQTFPLLNAVVMNYFTRGAISGLGLLDFGLGTWELWRLRKRKTSLESG